MHFAVELDLLLHLLLPSTAGIAALLDKDFIGRTCAIRRGVAQRLSGWIKKGREKNVLRITVADCKLDSNTDGLVQICDLMLGDHLLEQGNVLRFNLLQSKVNDEIHDKESSNRTRWRWLTRVVAGLGTLGVDPSSRVL